MIRTISRGCHWIADRWCYALHPNTMWPIGQRYRCAKCGRSYPIPWANPPRSGRTEAKLTCQEAPAGTPPRRSWPGLRWIIRQGTASVGR